MQKYFQLNPGKKNLLIYCLSHEVWYCAAVAAFWATQQKVAIPGWLRSDQKEGLC
jgi:hypothetical protein